MSRITMLGGADSDCKPVVSCALNRTNFRTPSIPKSIELPFAHRLFVPECYEPGYAYPLVVWLHSDASSEMELDGVMAALSRRNYIAIAPRGNVKSKGSCNRYRWGTSATDCAVAEDFVWSSVCEVAELLSVNLNKVFLAGFGAGGSMAQWIGLKCASQIAGVVSISGAFPKSPRSLSNWKLARHLRTLLIQRQGSSLCSDDEFIRAVKLAHQSGLNYRFVQAQTDTFDTNPDELDSSMLDAANRFMMGIVTGMDLPLTPESTCDSEEIPFATN
jgi:phospholipase/carboxylesterase